MSLEALRIGEALALLRHCLSKGGSVTWGLHFKKALEDEKVAFADAWQVLRAGRIYEAPEPDIKTGEWKYRVEGHTPDGAWLVIVFCFKELNKAFLITVFSVEKRRRSQHEKGGVQ
jgi:uncharacterized DUF497 family protein